MSRKTPKLPTRDLSWNLAAEYEYETFRDNFCELHKLRSDGVKAWARRNGRWFYWVIDYWDHYPLVSHWKFVGEVSDCYRTNTIKPKDVENDLH